MTTLEAYNLVQTAAKQAKALAVLADGLFNVANLEAQAKEQTKLLASAKEAVAAATAEHAKITARAEATLASAVSESKSVVDRANAEAARIESAAKERANKLVDDGTAHLNQLNTTIADATKRLDALARDYSVLLDKRDVLTHEVDALRSKFKQLVT